MKSQAVSAFSKMLFPSILACMIIFSLFSCEKEKKDPVLETTSIIGLSSTNYYVSAKITEKGDYKIIDYGFAYYIGSGDGTNYYNYKTVSLGNTITRDTFSTVLNVGSISSYYTDYHCFAKAYVTNEKGTMYGKAISTELVLVALKSLEPAIGRSGDTISLHGSYFNPNPSENQVYFSYTNAVVLSGTTKLLRVIVPGNISSNYGNKITVKVQSNEEESSISDAFELLSSPQGFSPSHGTWGTSIYVTGSGMYEASIYYDNIFIGTNGYNSSSFYINIPNTFLKKQFKIYLSNSGVKTEVPGGYFRMDDLVVDSPSSSIYNRGATIYVTGYGLNPSTNYTKMMLGNTVINAYTCSSYHAYFDVPNNMPLGTYVTRLTNSVDTITLVNPLTIVAK